MSTGENSPSVPEQTRQQTQEIIESIGDGLLSLDRAWRFVYINRKAAQNVGYEPEQLTGKIIWEAFPAILGTDHEVYYRQVMETRQFAHFELNGVLTQQSYDIRIYPSTEGISVYWLDITQQKQVEKRLQESERKYRELVKNAPAAIYEIDFRTRRFVTVNDAMCEMSGYSRDELLQMDPSAILDEDSRRLFMQRILQAQRGERPAENVEYRVLAKDGHEIISLLNTTFKTDENGRIISGAVIGHDITPRKQAETALQQANETLQVQTEELEVQAEELQTQSNELSAVNESLRANERKLRDFLESTHDYFLSLDRDWRVMYANAGFAKVMGLTPQELNGCNFWEKFPKYLDTSIETYYHRAMEERTPVHFEIKGFYTPYWYSVSVYPTEAGISVFITDKTAENEARHALEEANATLEERIAERTHELESANEELTEIEEELRSQNEALENALAREKNLQAQLIQSEKFAALARLVGSVAHEINNPLQTVKNCLYLLRTETVPESRAEILNMAVAETQRMADLVQYLRQTYRPSHLQPVDFDLNDVLAKVKGVLEPQFKQNKVKWQMQAPPGCILLHGIPDQIQQVCLNICLNAVEVLSAAGGQLDIAVSLPPGSQKVRIAFHDSGPGIPADCLNQIFEPFFTTKDKGTGLGLAISYEIVKNHGGEITAASPPGGGAIFTVWLPVKA